MILIMIISGVFSLAFYNSSTREINRLIHRLEFEQRAGARMVIFPDAPNAVRGRALPSVEELEFVKRSSFLTLLIVNAAILIFSGVAGYVLAGQTLQPIKLMMDEQTEFIANASHELRTPLATLRAEMEGQLLEKHISDKAARGLITSNLEEVGTLQSLTNNLLRLTQVHGQSQESMKEDVSLMEVLQSAQKKVSSLAKKKAIKLSIEAKDFHLHGDTLSLTELFVILFDNAVKYSPKNTTISVTTKAQKQSVKVHVTDHGFGITDRDLPFIFNRFYRADSSRSQADGYGLGLSIAKQIAEAHQGKIFVESVVDHGTTFVVELPLS